MIFFSVFATVLFLYGFSTNVPQFVDGLVVPNPRASLSSKATIGSDIIIERQPNDNDEEEGDIVTIIPRAPPVSPSIITTGQRGGRGNGHDSDDTSGQSGGKKNHHDSDDPTDHSDGSSHSSDTSDTSKEVNSETGEDHPHESQDGCDDAKERESRCNKQNPPQKSA